MINIAYFSNQFASASGHGIAHYAHRLYDGLLCHADLKLFPVATGSDRDAGALSSLQSETGLRLLPWGRKLTPLAWMYLNRPPVEQWLDDPVDITHMLAPGFPVATRRKLVVTVHDLGPISHPEFFSDSKPWLFRRGIAQTIRQADVIICVSQATADDLIVHAGEALRERIQVIHEGVDFDFFNRPSAIDVSEKWPDLAWDSPYMLAAGALSPRKNIHRVLDAFTAVKDRIPHRLVLAGGGGWDSARLLERLNSPELAGRVLHLGYVSDEELQALYKQADVYVHASLFEGFGLTVLEAMAAGCPVITSSTTSLPEVAGDAARLVQPDSEEAIRTAMLEVASSDTVKESMRASGLQQARRFTWDHTAAAVAEIYRSLS